MTERTVKAILKADVSGLVAGMRTAQKATEDFAGKGVKSAGDNKQAWGQLGTGALVAGAAVAVGVGLAVKAYADFSKEMSGVQAVSGANAKQMDALSKAAIKAGADTVFSASEAAKAEGELAKAGVSTADILGGALTGSLNLASAGGLDLANAATISAQAMNIFKLGGQDVAHIADVLASGANKSAADVAGLGEALKQGGLVAAQTGLHLEDTVGVLSMFADSALIGSDAGTSLKTMLMRLTPQSLQASEAMKAIGFSAYDANGKFVGMESVAQQLKTGLGGLTEQQRAQALTTIFGSDATRAASILYEQGAAGVKEYTAAVNDNGAAQRMASTMLNNLSGDFEQLRGSIDTALIQSGSAGNGVLRDLVQGATSAVNAFGNLPAPLQQGALGLGAVAAAGLLAVGGFMTVIPKIAETKKSLEALGIASKLTKANLMSVATGPIGIGLAVLTVAIGAFAKSQMDAKARSDDLRNSLDQQTGAITDQTRALVAKQLQEDGAFQRARDLGVSVKILTDAAMGQAGAIDYLRGKQAEQNSVVTTTIAQTSDLNAKMSLTLGTTNAFAGASEKTVAGAKNQSASFGQLLASVAPINDVLSGQSVAQKELATATGDTTGSTGLLTGSQQELKISAEDVKTAIDAEVQSMQSAGLVVLSTRDANRQMIASQWDVDASIKKNGTSLDEHTVKGQENLKALDGRTSAALRLADSIYKETGSEEAMRVSLVSSRADLVKTYLQFDHNKARAEAYADSVLKIPSKVETQVGLDTAAATKAAAAFVAKYQHKSLTMYLQTVDAGYNPSGMVRKAAGGLLSGPGTGTSDSIPMWGSNGEYVVKEKAVAKYGVATFDAMNSMRFSAGGSVGSRSSSSPAAATAGFNVERMTVVGYNPDDAVRQFGREVAWQMAGR